MGEKDISEKLLADYEDVFADIVNVLLFHGERRVHADSLQSTNTVSHYKADDSRLHEQERDILKAWIDGRIQIALLGLEHQTEPEKQMAVRVIGYEGANYRSQYKATQITPVITLVLYFGTEKRWQYPQNLKALMDIPDGLESYVNDYRIHVFEIAWLAEEQINMFQSDFRVVARYFSEKRKNKDYVPHDKTILKHVDAVLKLLAVMSGDHRYETLLADPEQKGEVKTMDEALTRVINEGHARGLAEGRNEGMAKGLAKGLAEGQIKTLVSLCRSGNISVKIAADQLKISTDEFQKYLDNDAAVSHAT